MNKYKITSTKDNEDSYPNKPNSLRANTSQPNGKGIDDNYINYILNGNSESKTEEEKVDKQSNQTLKTGISNNSQNTSQNSEELYNDYINNMNNENKTENESEIFELANESEINGNQESNTNQQQNQPKFEIIGISPIKAKHNKRKKPLPLPLTFGISNRRIKTQPPFTPTHKPTKEKWKPTDNRTFTLKSTPETKQTNKEKEKEERRKFLDKLNEELDIQEQKANQPKTESENKPEEIKSDELKSDEQKSEEHKSDETKLEESKLDQHSDEEKQENTSRILWGTFNTKNKKDESTESNGSHLLLPFEITEQVSTITTHHQNNNKQTKRSNSNEYNTLAIKYKTKYKEQKKRKNKNRNKQYMRTKKETKNNQIILQNQANKVKPKGKINNSIPNYSPPIKLIEFIDLGRGYSITVQDIDFYTLHIDYEACVRFCYDEQTLW